MTDPQRVARERLAASSAAIVAGVRRHGAGYLERRGAEILDAWGRLDAVTRAEVERALTVAAEAATGRVVADLEHLFARPVAEQRTTPLAVVRTLVREPTAVLGDAGIPPIERDEFETRALPDDSYALAPRDLGALGDPELAPLHLVWGMAKAELLRGS